MRKAELLGLTGVRFYAALFVYLSHVVGTIPGMEALGGSFLVFNAGVVAVSFFFVLSGFILTYNYADMFRDGVTASSYKKFVWDRLTRIYPVHLLAMLLVMPIALLSPNLPLDWRAVPVHLLLLQCWWPSTIPDLKEYLNVPSWALSCEGFFYILAPITIFFAVGEKGRRWIPVAVIVIYACGLGWTLWHSQSDAVRLHFMSWFAPTRFAEFLAGVFLARSFLASSSASLGGASGWLQAAGIGLIIAGAVYRQIAPWPLWGGLLYLPGSALLILGLAFGRGIFAGHLSHPWVRSLGLASFSFYMIHAPLLRAAKGVFLHFGWEVHSWPLFWGVTVTLLVLIQGIALGVLFAFEFPVQERLRSLARV
jgi:peptidoglycan/LPS O-acetylase OafA/YrhL